MRPNHAFSLAVLGLAAKADDITSLERRQGEDWRSSFNSQPLAIGTGDRFLNGQVAPRGLATQDRDLESMLNVGEIESGLRGLANAYDDVTFFTAPEQTFEQRWLHGVKIGRSPQVLIQSGIHGRERGGPDGVLYFISDLMKARAAGTGLRYGNRSYTNSQVHEALSVGIAILPLVNPDGMAYDHQTNSCWRKNRNPYNTSAGAADGGPVGVDLNRNFDVMWDYRRVFNSSVNRNVASDNPESQLFHGKAPLSEPETRNVDWLIGQLEQLSWFLDLHSYSGRVMYGWGSDDMQTTDPEQNFNNTRYDGKRGILGDDAPESQYREYIEEADLQVQRAVAERMAAAMSSLGNVEYKHNTLADLHPSSGSSCGHAMGKYYGHKCGANRIHGMAIEFGEMNLNLKCVFYPDNGNYHKSLRDVAVGLMELLLSAAGDATTRKVYEC